MSSLSTSMESVSDTMADQSSQRGNVLSMELILPSPMEEASTMSRVALSHAVDKVPWKHVDPMEIKDTYKTAISHDIELKFCMWHPWHI